MLAFTIFPKGLKGVLLTAGDEDEIAVVLFGFSTGLFLKRDGCFPAPCTEGEIFCDLLLRGFLEIIKRRAALQGCFQPQEIVFKAVILIDLPCGIKEDVQVYPAGKRFFIPAGQP